MPTLAEITNAAQYKGDAALGGFGGAAYNIDTRPLQQLAQYTFLYNKSNYDQRQKDADEAIKKLAALTSYDLTKARDGKDKEAANAAMIKLWEYKDKVARRGTPKSPSEKLKWAEEDGKATKEHTDTIDAIVARGLAYTTNKNEILKNEQGLSGEEIDAEIKALDELYDKTDFKTQIPSLPTFKIPDIKVAAAPTKTVSQIVVSDEGVTDVDHTIFDPKAAKSLSFSEVRGLIVPPLKADATDAEKAEYRAKIRSNRNIKVFEKMATVYNIAFNDPKYKKEATTTGVSSIGELLVTQLTNEVDLEKIKENPILQGQQELIARYNKWAAEKKADVLAGKYKDKIDAKTGLVTTITADEFFQIDPTKPLQPEDIDFLEKFRVAAPDKVEKKYTNTGLGTQNRNINLDYKVAWKNAETARINALKPDGSGSSGKPETVISQPAILFGEHINRLKTEFTKNKGKDIIVPFRSVDEKTRVATKLKDKEYIIYKQDGSYVITKDKTGQDREAIVSVGTIDNLAQGYIDAVKTIDLDQEKDKDGTMAEGFQVKSEAFFNQTFGTASGKTIWDNWGTGTQPNKPASAVESKDKMSDEEYQKFLKANGLK